MCVTDRNPEHDPADIRGAARSDPNAADSDTDEDIPGNYPTHADGRERANTCATCQQEIPDGRSKCPHCASNTVREPSDGDDTAVDEWTFGRVVVAVVPGNSTYHARALGASAFTVSDSIATGSDVAPERAHEGTGDLTGRADVIERLRGVVSSLPAAAQRMLSFYRGAEICDPVDAHVAAGEVGDTHLAYSRNRLLRRAGFVEHVGRGRYAYALPGLVREEFADRLDDDELRAVVAAVEAAFASDDDGRSLATA